VKRRTFIAGLGSAAAWPVVARAQQPTLPVVAVLSSASPEILAAKNATATIPIVFAMGGDPTELGLASFNRPVGNVTGITQYAFVLGTKRIQLLHDLVPKARKFGILINPSNLRASTLESLRPAIQVLGGTVEVQGATTEGDFDAAFASLAQKGVEALSVVPESLFSTRAERLVALAARYAIPTIYPERESAAAGGLCSYGASIPASYRQAGGYAARILKGEKPEDLPIVGPTKFDLVINLKTAKALGLTVPPILQATADEVIE